MLNKLAAGYRIINLDESTISCSNFRRYSWRRQNDTAYINKKAINPRITLVAAVDNIGNKYASFFIGNSNSKTTCRVVEKLVAILDEEDPNWREHSLLMLDGARYHKTAQVKHLLKQYHVPTLYVSPYSPHLCPIELFFSQLKRGDLNPEEEP